jgi:hypothetical protein
LYDKLLGYDSALDRFFPLSASGEYLLGISQAGITLENLDAISSSIDALTLTLDAYAIFGPATDCPIRLQPQAGLFHRHKPRSDAGKRRAGHGRAAHFRQRFPTRDRRGNALWLLARTGKPSRQRPTAGTEVLISSRTGRCDMRRSTRYSRFKVRIPAGTTWTFCAGIEPDISADGET